ncbi:type IV pilus biogenesis/stability protein PilW [Rheinheimera aquimaris]|uniref:type IV pilus biogenesis/stability protein PilW n=2 Tax=Rheinheimera aquimaris TaxID=412437 RepID=UPI001E4B6BCD|nr:type IV pilus biogenesis/stability protein PilW [Rheinheimera aquimaris]
MKQKVIFGISLCSVLVLTGCVSEQSYVGSDKPVSDRTFDNIEAARTRISLGLNYLRRGDTSQAKYNLERARSFAPNSAEVHSALAYYYQSVGETKQAEEYFRLAIQKDSNYADAYNNYGAFLCQLHRYDEAEQLLLKAISRPGYIRVAESYENLALCQLQQNDFSKAMSYLEQSLSHNTTRITSLTLAAGLTYAMGNMQQAKLQLDRIQRLGRVSARTVLLSYLIAEKNGDRETMRNAEQLLLTLYTETPETRLLLQGKLQESEFEQLRERYKDSLMANIVLPDDNASQTDKPVAPVANPKLKVVKRKTVTGDSDESTPAGADASSTPAATPLKQVTSDIANSLSGTGTAVVAASTGAATLPVETVTADNSYDRAKSRDAEAAEEKRLKAEQEAAALAQAEQQRLKAEQEAAALAQAEQQRLKAEQEAAALAQAEQQRLKAEQEAAALAQAEQQRLKAEQEAAALAQAEQQRLKAEQEAAALAQAEQQRLKAEQEAAALAQAEQQRLKAEQEAAALAQAEQQRLKAEQEAAALAQAEQQKLEAEQEAAALAQAEQQKLEAEQEAAALAQAEQQKLKAEQEVAALAQLQQEQVTAEQTAVATVQEVAAAGVDTPLSDSEQLPAFHLVQASESLYAISVQHNIRLQRLMEWNQLAPDSVIKTGQKIWLGPVSETVLHEVSQPEREQVEATEPFHTVAEGETMFGISFRYNVRLSSFMSWNNLTEQSTLKVGQQVYITDPASVAQ